MITDNSINHCYTIVADIPSCIDTAIPVIAATHSRRLLWIHSGSRYNYCDCSNYCLVSNPLIVDIAAVDDLTHPDSVPGISTHFRQAGYIAVTSPNSSTRCY